MPRQLNNNSLHYTIHRHHPPAARVRIVFMDVSKAGYESSHSRAMLSILVGLAVNSVDETTRERDRRTVMSTNSANITAHNTCACLIAGRAANGNRYILSDTETAAIRAPVLVDNLTDAS